MDDPSNSERPGKKLRVAGVDPERDFAGGESQVLGLTLQLLRQGHRGELICDPRGKLWEMAVARGITCHPLAIRNAVDLPAGVRLRRILIREGYDVIHFHTSRAHALAPFARGLGAVLIATRRMDYPPGKLSAKLFYGRAVDAIIAISAGVAEALARAGVDPKRVVLVPSGVDTGRFRPPASTARAAARLSLGLGPDEAAVGTLGALEDRKGHRYLIEAIARLHETGLPVRCFIAGTGLRHTRLTEMIRAFGLERIVTLTGNLENPLALLAALDIFALPSLNEGLGVALLEAMACGLASIGSAVGGIVDAIEDGRDGLLVEPANADALAGAIRRLAGDTDLAGRLGAAASAKIEEKFSVAGMAHKTVEVYRERLDGRRNE